MRPIVRLPGKRLTGQLPRLSRPQLLAAKVSGSNCGPNRRKFRRHFKGVFGTGNIEVRILRGQPGGADDGKAHPVSRRKARHWRAFAIQLAVSRFPLEGLGQYAKSLRPLPRIFPFSGDGCRRLSSIITAWRVPESYRSGGVRQEEIVSPHSIRPRKGDVP
jgi:hypothetical protein